MKLFSRSVLLFALLLASSVACAQDAPSLETDLAPWISLIKGEYPQFAVSGWAEPVIDGRPQRIDVRVARYDDQAFDLELAHEKYAVTLRRRADATALALPKHHRVFLGRGATDVNDHLSTAGLLGRLISTDSTIRPSTELVWRVKAKQIVGLVKTLAKIKFVDEQQAWSIDNKHELRFSNNGKVFDGQADDVKFHLELSTVASSAVPADQWQDFEIVPIERAELEKQLARGVHRTCEVVAPGSLLTSSVMKSESVDHGELRWIDGQRVCLLAGTPEQIGEAHGKLLCEEANRCIDSVLYTFGTIQTVSTGRWFRHDLEQAYASLAPHIPERHKAETRAIASSLNVSPDLMEALNVFPELFHCSGFALFGDATVDGKLYHGRVLDYMTMIGLQHAATTFIVAPQGKIPFVNVGYAGFVGSVSGMNAQKISLGEMGGKGEGQWNGVPMATLMRRALEECHTLADVKQLWSSSPRTCEYFYVFSDGKDRSAVGVAATPESIEFVEPGAAHPRLGEGIANAVVLSAGSRLQELRHRVQTQYGKIDAVAAMHLMSRPVAMKSNLHNVLFVPEDGVLYVANADHELPAADRPYSKFDLNALLNEPIFQNVEPESLTADTKFTAIDSLALDVDANADAEDCLSGLRWNPAQFDVLLQSAKDGKGDWLVRFDSPVPSGHAQNDSVSMEWYQAKDGSGNVVRAPAVVVVHESASSMPVGRLIAQTLRSNGIHTFMIHLPYYGERRPPEGRARGKLILQAIRQAVADVRRARDAVASLPMVDSDQISLQGTSLGGFVTATVAGLDQGYHNVIILLAGGQLYETLMGGQRDAAKVRRELEGSGLSAEEIRTGLNAIEPLRLAHRMRPQNTWVYSGVFDEVVQPQSSDMLVKAAGLDRSHHIQMLANHYSGIIFLPIIALQMSHIVKDQRLAVESATE